MPSPNQSKAEELARERDEVFYEIYSLVVEEDLSAREKIETAKSIEFMLAIFRERLYGNLCGGVISDGKPWEERLIRQVEAYPRIPVDKRPLVVDILRAVVEEKIKSDNQDRNI